MSETTTVHAADIFTADQVREVDYNALEIAESLGDDVTCLVTGNWSRIMCCVRGATLLHRYIITGTLRMANDGSATVA